MSASVHPEAVTCTAQKLFTPRGGKQLRSHKAIREDFQQLVYSGKAGYTSNPRSHRYNPGVLALKDIQCYQKSTNLLISQLPFQQLIGDLDH